MRFVGNKIFVARAIIAIAAIARSKRGKREMFFKCYDSSSIASQFTRGNGPAETVASWTADVMRFKAERSQYLLY